MNETTATTIQTIHDTVSVMAHSQGVTVEQYVKGGIYTALSTGAVWLAKYFFHDRKKAKENAFVATTEAQQKAETLVIKEEANAEATMHRSRAEIIMLWENRAKELDTQNLELRAALDVAYSQAASTGKKLAMAEANFEIAQGRIAALEFEIVSLKERLAADAEILAEVPKLQKMLQEALQEKQHYINEMHTALNLIHP